MGKEYFHVGVRFKVRASEFEDPDKPGDPTGMLEALKNGDMTFGNVLDGATEDVVATIDGRKVVVWEIP